MVSVVGLFLYNFIVDGIVYLFNKWLYTSIDADAGVILIFEKQKFSQNIALKN
jgi:hypothetical protein